jgi:hypothetical protein
MQIEVSRILQATVERSPEDRPDEVINPGFSMGWEDRLESSRRALNPLRIVAITGILFELWAAVTF